jgi:hypothetical protein
LLHSQSQLFPCHCNKPLLFNSNHFLVVFSLVF